MSYYYKYNFVSPESIYAEVKEELKSYFDTGIVDDVLFTRYTEDCLKRLGRGTFKIVENIFKIENYICKLPSDFEAVREVWLATSFDQSYKLPTACYEQTTCRITPERDRCDECDVCAPKEVKITYKTTGKVIQSFNVHYLLKPGNISVRKDMSLDCKNVGVDSIDTFDIRDGKLITNFSEGTVYMVYYISAFDENEYQMIPDNIRIKDYIKAYLKYKCFETVYNNVTDETFKQVESKFVYYKRESDEAKIMADTEMKKQTITQVMRSIKSQRNRFRDFYIK